MYGIGLLTLLVAVHAVCCIVLERIVRMGAWYRLGSICVIVLYSATVRHQPDGLDATILGLNLKPFLMFSGTC